MELIKIAKSNIELLGDVMDLIFDEWGDGFSCSKEEKLNKFKTPILNGENFPHAYLLKNDNNDNIGSFLILEHELKGSDLSPWLACVVVNKKYRGQGYGSVLLDHIKRTIEENFSEIYLTTELVGFYEKIGFKLIKLIDNNGKNNRLYCKIK
ncbi:MAG: GNAT family N-acetyltransferase [Clostridia bacterium]